MMATDTSEGPANLPSHVPEQEKMPTTGPSPVSGVLRDGSDTKPVEDSGAAVVHAIVNVVSTSQDNPEANDTSDVAVVQPIAGEMSKSETDAKAVDASHETEGQTQPEEKASLEPTGPTSPASAQATASQTDKLARPKHRDEKMLHAYITKAHAQVREGTVVASSPEDQEKAIVKYAEMVSQMTHLLASLGIGRNTTVRALGYLNSPEQPTPAQAIRQAKQDRRERNDRKRVPSNESSKNGANIADNEESKAVTAATSVKTAIDGSVSASTPTLTGSDETSLADKPPSERINSENQKPEAPNGVKPTIEPAKTKNQKKNTFRRKWWGGKGRRRTTFANSKEKNSEVSNPTAEKAVAETPKVEKNAVSGTPNADGSAAAVPIG